MENRGLSDAEIRKIIDSVEHKLVAEEMDTKNNVGRTITVVDEKTNKRSGGIMISSKDVADDAYMGNYYNLEEILAALNEFVEKENEKESSGFERKGKVQLDQEGIDEALEEYTSLVIEKQKDRNPGFYTVSRSDEDSEEFKQTGGLISSEDVKEGQYVDEEAAIAIINSLLKVPTEEEMEEAIEKITTEESEVTEFERKKVPNQLFEKLKKYAKRIATILLIPIISAAIIAADVTIIDEGKYNPNPEKRVEYIIDEAERMVSEVDGNHDLEIGDVVVLGDGETYYHNSEENDGLSGNIGEGIREEGEYTVDVISIHDEDGNLIAYTYDRDGSLGKLLDENGYSMEDITSGKVSAKYNLIEGKDKDVGIDKEADREKAAGWVEYDHSTYEDVGNVIHNNDLGGKNI